MKFFLLLLTTVSIIALDQLAGSLTGVDPVSVFRRAHPFYHHDLRPLVRARTEWGHRRYRIATNSLGFRDAGVRIVPEKSPKRRILLMGDSFTEALGVEWEESFAGRLSAAAGADIEVLNAGVIGYSPKVYFAKVSYLLDEIGLEIDEVFVFVDLSDVPNEILYAVWESSNEPVPPATPPGLGTRLRRGSLLLRSLSLLMKPSQPEVAWNFHGMPFAEDLMAPALKDPAFYTDDDWTLDYKYARRGMNLARAHMDALAALCRERDLALTLVIYPWPKNILAGALDHPHVKLWTGFAKERGLRLVNLFPDFIRKGEDPADVVARYFIEGDVHWNETGHELVARRIEPLL